MPGRCLGMLGFGYAYVFILIWDLTSLTKSGINMQVSLSPAAKYYSHLMVLLAT